MTAIEAILRRLAQLRAVHRSYRAYQRQRVKERDHHGAWDVAVNLSETECEMAGLRFALLAIKAGPKRHLCRCDRTCDVPWPDGVCRRCGGVQPDDTGS